MDKIKKAAIVLLGMGQEQAAEVLKHMDHKQVEKIVTVMNEISNVSETEVSGVLDSFIGESKSQTGLGLGSGNYIRDTLVTALGSDKAKALLDKTTRIDSSDNLSALKWKNLNIIADFIRDEHPQVIAIVLTYLESEQAAQMLEMFDEARRVDLMKRLAVIGALSPLALNAVNEVLGMQSTDMDNFKQMQLGGAKAAASIINFLDSDTESKVIKELGSFDESLMTQVQDMMFPFENLSLLDDRDLQKLLRDVPTETLQVALKAADQELREKFFKNMSSRAADMLKDDMEASGPVQLSKAVSAQKEIVALAQTMAQSGDIIIAGSGEEMVS